jgi:hypothetical protein
MEMSSLLHDKPYSFRNKDQIYQAVLCNPFRAKIQPHVRIERISNNRPHTHSLVHFPF